MYTLGAQEKSQGLRTLSSFEEFQNKELFFHKNARYTGRNLSKPSKSVMSNPTTSISQGLQEMNTEFLAHEKENMQTDDSIFISTDDVVLSIHQNIWNKYVFLRLFFFKIELNSNSSTDSIFASGLSQGFRTIDKAPLVHERESMQTDLPIDQVKQFAQIVETSMV